MRHILIFQLFLGCLINHAFAQSDDLFPNPYVVFEIEPSKTNPEITEANTPHFVVYNPSTKQDKLLLFMPGTNGIALKGPKNLFLTAVIQGYRVINMSYINTPAVAQICRGDMLEEYSNCAEQFRQKRVFGNNEFSLIDDKPYDAIANRLTKLLVYLCENDQKGNWEKYLENGEPKWSEIAVAGQSQGGGMAAFIAKQKLVPRVISFSGGWDYSNSETKTIASWYFNESVTPTDRYFGTYHVAEPTADIIDESYKAMKIPDNHVYKFDLKVPEGKKAHSDGVRNVGYTGKWIELLGKGN